MDMHKLNSLHNTGCCCLDKVAAFNNFKNGRTKAVDKLVERQFDDSVASDRNTEERGKIKKRTKIDAVRQFGLPLLREWHAVGRFFGGIGAIPRLGRSVQVGKTILD